MTDKTPQKLPTPLLERLALGELPPEQAARAQARLDAEPDGAARLASLQEDNQRHLRLHDPARVARQIELRLHSQRVQARHAQQQRRRWTLALAVPALAAAAALLLLWPQGGADAPLDPYGVQQDDTVRIKGDPLLFVHRKKGQEAEPLRRGDTASPGDTLQLSYSPAGWPYGAILSLDGRGAVTWHMPPQPQGQTALARPDEQQGAQRSSLGHAYQLDDAPRFEIFIMVASRAPLDLALVDQAAQEAAQDPDWLLEMSEIDAANNLKMLDLPESLAQTHFLVRKP